MKFYSTFSAVLIIIVAVIFQVEIVTCQSDSENIDYDADVDVSCDSQIADRCFGDVQDDLRVIFDSTNKNVKPTNITLLKDLCSAWEDSLNCTSDVIDDGCNVNEGRTKFDHWNSAFRATHAYICSEDLRVLRDVFYSISCFNISGFLSCMSLTTKLNHVAELLATELDYAECRFIHDAMEKCGEYVVTGTCSGEVLEPIVNIFDEFVKASNCTKTTTASPLTGSSNHVINSSSSLEFVLYFLFLSLQIYCKF